MRGSWSSLLVAAGSRSCVTPTAALGGIGAVIDKDLAAALLARSVGADVLVIATDVPAAILRFGTPEAEPVGQATVEEMRAYAAEGHFASGSMGPKVDAACRFVEQGGQRAVITNLDNIVEAVTASDGSGDRPAPAPSSYRTTERNSHA